MLPDKLSLDFDVGRIGTDKRAVSPVIGVILMVAITVILGAVIGAFVLNLGGSLGDSGPTAQLTMSTTGNTDVSVTHKGGDKLAPSELKIIVEGGNTTENASTVMSGAAATGGFSVGESFTITQTEGGWSDGDTVTIRIIHKPSQKVLAESQLDI